jgi:hypothetical protein
MVNNTQTTYEKNNRDLFDSIQKIGINRGGKLTENFEISFRSEAKKIYKNVEEIIGFKGFEILKKIEIIRPMKIEEWLKWKK